MELADTAPARKAFLSYHQGESPELRMRVVEMLDSAGIAYVADFQVLNPFRIAVDSFLLDLLRTVDFVIVFPPSADSHDSGGRARRPLLLASVDLKGRLRAMLRESDSDLASRALRVIDRPLLSYLVAFVLLLFTWPLVVTLLVGRAMRMTVQKHVLRRQVYRQPDESWQEWEVRVAEELGKPIVAIEEAGRGAIMVEGPSARVPVMLADNEDGLSLALDAAMMNAAPVKSRVKPTPELGIGCGYAFLFGLVVTLAVAFLFALLPTPVAVLAIIVVVYVTHLWVIIPWLLVAIVTEILARRMTRPKRRDRG